MLDFVYGFYQLYQTYIDTYSETSQTSKMEFFLRKYF